MRCGEKSRAIFAVLLLIGSSACSTTSPIESRPSEARATAVRENPLVRSLLQLARADLRKGDLAAAEGRFGRVLEIRPRSKRALIGMADIARARKDGAGEREWLAEVIEIDPDSKDALERLASLASSSGDPDGAKMILRRALENESNDPTLLAMLFDLTYPSPEFGKLSPDETLAAAQEYPFDLSLRLRAAELRVERGDIAGAIRELKRSYWLADLDPKTGKKIRTLLATLDSAFASRKVVPVHLYVDETISSTPGWEMRMRILWRKSSASLDALLGTHFVLVSMDTFSTRGLTPDMPSLYRRWLESQSRWPDHGLLIALTELRPTTRPGDLLGQAELLGRRSIVRLKPGSSESRTLIHEIVHLYGGVHVAHIVDSLMNPSGSSMVMDPINLGILAITKNRRFGPGGLPENLLRYIEERELIEAYSNALQLNLKIRRAGLEEATRASEDSRYIATSIAMDAQQLDDHLAQIAITVSNLYWRDKLYARAADYCDLAALLSGVESPIGRNLIDRAGSLRRLSEAVYGSPGSSPTPYR